MSPALPIVDEAGSASGRLEMRRRRERSWWTSVDPKIKEAAAKVFHRYLPAGMLWLLGTCAAAQGVCDTVPAVEGPRPALAAALCRTLDPPDRTATLLHGVVVEYQGHRVAERYFAARDKVVGSLFGHDTAFAPQTLHDMRSITKSVVSLLIGIAQRQGKLGSIDTPVLNYLSASDKPPRMASGWEPALDLIVVIVAGRYDAPDESNGRPSQELFRQILAQVVRSR